MEDFAARRGAHRGTSAQITCPCCGNPLSLAAFSDQVALSSRPVSNLAAIGPAPLNVCQDFESRVIALVADGQTDEGIARQLDAPLHRIKRSVREWMIRLDAQNRTSAAVRAARHGLLPPPGGLGE